MNVKPPSHAGNVRRLFGRIAGRYDLMNRLMTGGQDLRWRREVIRRARLQPGDRVLDLGAGTGDLAFAIRQQHPQAQPVAADFTLEMMQVGRRRGAMNWAAADALALPFREGAFEAIVSGFLMRNVADVFQALQEQHRILQPGGRIVILDTTRPRKNLLTPFIWLHMHAVIPLLGGLLTGHPEDYRYLTASTENFLRAEELASLMAAAGFRRVGFQRLMFGTIAIHWGEK